MLFEHLLSDVRREAAHEHAGVESAGVRRGLSRVRVERPAAVAGVGTAAARRGSGTGPGPRPVVHAGGGGCLCQVRDWVISAVQLKFFSDGQGKEMTNGGPRRSGRGWFSLMIELGAQYTQSSLASE